MEASLVKKINQYFHDEEALFFPNRHRARIKEETLFYRDFFENLFQANNKSIRILDVGAGTGLVASSLLSNNCQFICADISYRMLDCARNNLSLENKSLFFTVCDAENLPFGSETFDLITCNATMHHFPLVDKFLKELQRVLAKDGTLIIGFEPNRKFWTNRLVSLTYRVISKVKEFLQTSSLTTSYNLVCQRVNERLLQEGIINSPLSCIEILKNVDIHSPNAGERIDYDKGFDIDELIKQDFQNFDTKKIYHYDNSPQFFGIYNRLLFPKSAPQFSLILKKRINTKLKIVFVFVHLNYGGAEVGLLTTLKNIDRNRFVCTILSIEKKGLIGLEIERLGFKVLYLDDSARLFNLRLIGKIIRILDKEKPDILHTSLFYANFFGRLAALFRRPSVVIIEERSMYTEKRFYHIFCDRILSTFTDKIIVCSNSVLEFTIKQEKIKKEKFYLIYNVPDTERFDISYTKRQVRAKYGFSNESFIIGMVGSVIPKKGHRFLIDAANKLSKQIPELKILVVGDGESKQALLSKVKAFGLQDKVIFLGVREDIPALMKIMDVFVLPSLQEGFPRTLLEAMYIELPVIATNISGIPEIVVNGENGLLIPPEDSKAIESCVSILYRDIALRNRLGHNAREAIQSNFMPKNYVDRIEGLYLKLTGNTEE